METHPRPPRTRPAPALAHGTSGYRRGCRCDTCRAANAAYQRGRQRHGHIDRNALSDLLNELFPLGLTDDCPARRQLRDR